MNKEIRDYLCDRLNHQIKARESQGELLEYDEVAEHLADELWDRFSLRYPDVEMDEFAVREVCAELVNEGRVYEAQDVLGKH